jgi:hypothetical protein
MFYFEAENIPDNEEDAFEVKNQLEGLPWVSKNAFVAGQKKAPGEQKVWLANRRENWTFEDELEDSRQESGPEWLIVARAEASFVEPPSAQSIIPFTGAPDVRQCDNLISALDLAHANDSPMEDDDDQVHDLNRFLSALQLESFRETSKSPTVGSSPNRMPINPLFLSPSQKMTRGHSRRQSRQSFQSADASRRNSTLQSTATSALGDSYRTGVGIPEESFKQDLRSAFPTQAWQSPEQRESMLSSQNQVQSHLPPPQNQTPSDLPTQESHSSQRIERMERLLERLIIFSGEQALAQLQRQQQPSSAIQANVDEVAALRQEIAELRRNVEIQQAEVVSPVEIACLRNEIALLRAQLGLPPNEPLDASTPTFEQID